MKTKLTAFLVILISSFAFSSCSEEEIKPTHVIEDEAQAQGVGQDDLDF